MFQQEVTLTPLSVWLRTVTNYPLLQPDYTDTGSNMHAPGWNTSYQNQVIIHPREQLSDFKL